MIVPKGVPVPTNSGSWMGHNEYIVYNMNQARIRYVLRMEMNGNWSKIKIIFINFTFEYCLSIK